MTDLDLAGRLERLAESAGRDTTLPGPDAALRSAGRRRKGGAAALAALVLAGAVTVVGHGRLADEPAAPPPPPPRMTLTLTPAEPWAGEMVRVEGSGCGPGGEFDLTIDDRPFQRVSGGKDGFSWRLSLPRDLASGRHRLAARCPSGAQALPLDFVVPGTPGEIRRPVVTLTPGRVTAPGRTVVRVTGCRPTDRVYVHVDLPQRFSVQVEARGAATGVATATVRVPASTPPGRYSLDASCWESGIFVPDTFLQVIR